MRFDKAYTPHVWFPFNATIRFVHACRTTLLNASAIVLLISAAAESASLTLQWDPPVDSAPTGYLLLGGFAPGAYCACRRRSGARVSGRGSCRGHALLFCRRVLQRDRRHERAFERDLRNDGGVERFWCVRSDRHRLGDQRFVDMDAATGTHRVGSPPPGWKRTRVEQHCRRRGWIGPELSREQRSRGHLLRARHCGDAGRRFLHVQRSNVHGG